METHGRGNGDRKYEMLLLPGVIIFRVRLEGNKDIFANGRRKKNKEDMKNTH